MFFVTYILDKLLITYYYKERVENNDFLNRNTLRVLKYGIILFLFIGGQALVSNYCAINNQDHSIQYMNEILSCRGMFAEPEVL